MRRKIPSTAALTAFEAAARHQSYTKAADELALTQSAVCRQIASLEDFLGVRLFQRTRRGVSLTEAGQRYSRRVEARLDEVERDTLDIMSKGAESGTLELGVVPTFATKWLVPRLADFASKQPGVRVNLSARTRPFLFEGSGLDAAIYAGETAWPGTDAVFLMKEELVAVGSPAFARARRSYSSADWQRIPLLQQSTRPYAWRRWFAAGGLRVEGDMAGPRFELFSMLTEAAIRGLGVALIPPFLVEDEIARGLLVRLTKDQHFSGLSYFLIYPEQNRDKSPVVVFRGWLEQQVRAGPSNVSVRGSDSRSKSRTRGATP